MIHNGTTMTTPLIVMTLMPTCTIFETIAGSMLLAGEVDLMGISTILSREAFSPRDGPPAPMGISTTLLRGWETMTRKIQIQSKKAKWALAQLDISTILYKHDVNDDNDESPAMLIEEAHLVPTLTILLKGSSL